MSPEHLRILASANAVLSGFIDQASAERPGRTNGDNVLRVVEAQLPAIVATVEEAGRTIKASTLSGNLDPESRAQIDLYTQHLRRLKSLLSPLLVRVEARRQQLRENTGKIREAMLWLSTLKSTGID